jgi:hypothetical protein
MESTITSCTWCGAGGDEGSAESFVLPAVVEGATAPAALSAVAAPDAFSPAISTEPFAPKRQNLSGIGGWLILVGVDLGLSPLGILLALGADLVLILGGLSVAAVNNPQVVAGLLAFDAFTQIIFLAAVIALNFYFYAKRKEFPRWMIAFLAARVVVTLAIYEMVLNSVPTYPATAAFGSFVSAGAWIPYFLISQRVKQTFVN